jgi:hypothetical protein
MRMVRTQIQLSEKQAKSLKRLSSEREEPASSLVRKAADILVASEVKLDRQTLKRRIIAASGKCRLKERALSTYHDIYLAEDYR